MKPSLVLYSQHLAPHTALHTSLHLREPNHGAEPLVEMNTTPLIDVLLVLIVMLIISIATPLHSVNLDMPSRQVTTTPKVVVLQIDAKGFVLWGEESLASMADVKARIAAAGAQALQPEIHLQPAPDTPYAFVADVLAMTKQAKLQKVGVVN